MLLHAGDLSYKGEKAEVADFLSWFSKQPFKHKIFIAGNHDFFFEKENQTTIEALIPEGVTYLNDSECIIDNIKIWGSPVTPWFYNWAFNRKRGAPIKKHWSKIPTDTQILLTHGPAFGMLDSAVDDKHAGCIDLLKTIQTIKPKVHVCGHIHEGWGKCERDGTKYINASVLNEAYELVNKPIVFEL